MSNTLLTSSEVTREAMVVLENSLVFTKHINRKYDNKFAVSGAKIGDSVSVRKPPRYVGRRVAARSIEDTTETSVTVTMGTQYGCDISFSTADLTLKIDDFSSRFIAPAIATIANMIDADGMALYTKVWQSVGTPGTTPNALLTYLLAGVALDNSSAPNDVRSIVLNPLMQATIVDALKGLFQQATEIAQQYSKGKMGTAGGFDWYMSQNIATHTVGPLGGTPLVNGASQTGASLVTDGWTASAASRLKLGDIFTIAGVYGVNPMSKATLSALQQFRVTANVSSDGSGSLTAAIEPSITTSGATQTVSGSPADNAALTVVGAASTVTPQGLAFHRDFATFVTTDLYVPRGVDMAARVEDEQLGISMRLVRDYEGSDDTMPCRLDVLGGWAVLRGELACRLAA